MVRSTKRRAVEQTSCGLGPGGFPYTPPSAKPGQVVDVCRGSFTERQSKEGSEIRDGSRSHTPRVVRRTFRGSRNEHHANSPSRPFGPGVSAHGRPKGTPDNIGRPAGPHRRPHATAHRAGNHDSENRSGTIFITIISFPIERAESSKGCVAL